MKLNNINVGINFLMASFENVSWRVIVRFVLNLLKWNINKEALSKT